MSSKLRSEALANKGVIALNCPEAQATEKTVVVLGLARGGTSMVAGALHHLGVYMGDNLSVVYEDVLLSGLVEAGLHQEIDQLVAHRNAQYSIWGWKRPSSIQNHATWEGKFRNVYYVVVFRDLLAIANRNRISMLADVLPDMRQSVTQLSMLLDFLGKESFPMLLVSYEKAMGDPGYFVRRLSEFVGVGDEQSIESAINFIEPSPSVYLEASRILRGTGVVDEVSRRRIAGWAMYVHTPDRPARVIVKLSGGREYALTADRLRPDVRDKGIHPSGHCGFLLELDEDSQLTQGDRVEIMIDGEVYGLRNSPAIVRS